MIHNIDTETYLTKIKAAKAVYAVKNGGRTPDLIVISKDIYLNLALDNIMIIRKEDLSTICGIPFIVNERIPKEHFYFADAIQDQKDV